jgi:5-methyltetrahydropteroyltriglutamate--homocysteine methyltransferase
MERSIDRVLTTHAGSMSRPEDLAQLLIARAEGEPVEEAMFEDRVREAVREVVAQQVELGIDVVSDGEMSKNTFIDYTRERLSGMTGGPAPLDFFFEDLLEFPEITYETYKDSHPKFAVCEGPVTYTGSEQIARDVRNLQAAFEKTPATEGFIPAASPGLVAIFSPNTYYPSYEEYLFAVAEAMNAEYRAIAEAGLVVQIDAPDVPEIGDLHTWMWSETEKRGVRKIQELHVEAINVALQGVSPESARLHLCWANYQGPHTHDQPLREVLQTAIQVNAAAINFEAANPAHAHEWEIFEEFDLPDDKILIPGVIDTKSQVVENPRVVAQRIVRYAKLVGQERVIAGTDCGFGTFVGALMVHPKVALLKLRALAEGAAIATQELGTAAVAG